MTATITVAVGWTSVRPVIPDQHISAVTVPLHLPAVVDDAAVRIAERHAMVKAFETVAARTHATQWMPKVEMITSMNIVKEVL